MKVKQIYNIVNDITKELLGDEAVVQEDLSNIVDLGAEFADKVGYDNYVKTLVDHIGKVIFKNQVYGGRAPSVLMDGWEYGSIVEKISPELPEAEENEDWQLTDGTSYDPNIFTKPKVSTKFWNSKKVFEIPLSIVSSQVKSSFDSPVQMNAFISMLHNTVQNSLTLKTDSLVMRTINNLIGETVKADFGGAALNSKSGIKAVNLLYLYNQEYPDATITTAEAAIRTTEFIRFAAMTMSNYIDRITVMSKLFNVGAKERFTPLSELHTIMLSPFMNAANIYLQSDTFHNEFTALPTAESVPYWQGSGTTYSFNDISTVNIKTSSGTALNISGVLGFMFDRNALGVSNLHQKVTTQYNGKADFWNEWYKFECGYFNDTNENAIVFFAE